VEEGKASLGNLGEASVGPTALDPDGNLHVVGRTADGQYIVSFDASGKYKSKVAIDPEQVVVQEFAVFKSGAFLVAGRSLQQRGRRLAVMSAGGGWHEVVLPGDPASKKGLSPKDAIKALGMSFAQPAPDGRVYFAVGTATGPVFPISPSGEVGEGIELVPPRPDAMLVGLLVSHGRLAATYATGSEESPMNTWASVSDLATGQHVALYGPLPGSVLCYESVSGFPDRFTMLSFSEINSMAFVHASAP